MALVLALSSALQRRLVDGLLDSHPLPWRIGPDESDWLCEVVDATKRVVLKCAKKSEAIELIDVAMALSASNARDELEVDDALQQERIMTTKPKNARDLFDKLLPLALTKYPAKVKEIGAIYCFKVTSSSGHLQGTSGDGGEWTVDCLSTPPTCTRGDARNAGCTIAIKEVDLMSIISDPNAAMQLYFQGRLAVSGDPMLAMRLQSLFAIVLPA